MAWHEVQDGVFPGEQEVVEVQLANGAVQLACFAKRTWQSPAASTRSLKRRPGGGLKVIKWRSFAESLTASRKPAKLPSDAYVLAASAEPEF